MHSSAGTTWLDVGDAGVAAIDLLLCVLALALSLLARPWRAVRAALWPPALALLVLLPWVWALPRLHAMPLSFQLSGACLAALVLGWPLAVPALAGVAVIADLIAPTDAGKFLHQLAWQGLVPASLSLGVGIGVRRWLGANPFLFILGRGFFGTAFAVFASNLLAGDLAQAGGRAVPHDLGLSAPTAWLLMSWSDAFLTGGATAVFVAYRPLWLSTWSDRLYLQPLQPPETGSDTR